LRWKHIEVLFALDIQAKYIHRLSVSGKDDRPDLLFPFDADAVSRPRIICPNPECSNDGMDGSITGRAGQWGIQRKCTKCGHTWSGGIGVQIADASGGMPKPGVVDPEDDVLPTHSTTADFRNPSKNFSGDE
jgi:hypothetical protein